MKALIRDEETIPENQWNDWISNNIDWLTTPKPNGDGYTLIDDYEPPGEDPLQ